MPKENLTVAASQFNLFWFKICQSMEKQMTQGNRKIKSQFRSLLSSRDLLFAKSLYIRFLFNENHPLHFKAAIPRGALFNR